MQALSLQLEEKKEKPGSKAETVRLLSKVENRRTKSGFSVTKTAFLFGKKVPQRGRKLAQKGGTENFKD